MTTQAVIGIDRTGGAVRVAKVIADSARPAVTMLGYRNESEIKELAVSTDEVVRLTVPDDQTIVKSLRLTSTNAIDLDRRAGFEMAQSLLDPEDAFVFDLLLSGADPYQLGLIYRRERLNTLKTDCLGDTSREVGYLARAASVGRGYLTFCRQIPGEVVVLADLTDCLASLCILFRRRPVMLSHMSLHGLGFASEGSLTRLAVELKTVLNFKLAELSALGINLPPAGLLLSGSNVTPEVREVFARYFPAGVIAPEINPAFFGKETRDDTNEVSSYLAALGLAVN